MVWFRTTLIFSMGGVFLWTLGETAGILLMCTNGANLQSMELDPARNGTLAIYVFILMFLFILMGFCFFGFILCIMVWKNRFQLDHKLRHYFIIWEGCWVGALMSNMGIAVYALVRNKDPQGQMGFMYEMFLKSSASTKFIASFEKYQRDNNCCGIYGPDDWMLSQIRSNPGGMGAMQSLDYGIQQNPNIGRCHMMLPAIPTGCGKPLMVQVNSVLNMYASLNITLIVMGAAAGILAWYCFFHWLEKEVIVIPEDEVSNIIIVEPESSDILQYHTSPPQQYFPKSFGYLQHGGYNIRHSAPYVKPPSYIRHGQSVYPVPASYRTLPREYSNHRTTVVARPSRFNPETSRFSRHYSKAHEPVYNVPNDSKRSRYYKPQNPVNNVNTNSRHSRNSKRNDPVYNVPTDSRVRLSQNTRREDPVYSVPTEIRLGQNPRRDDPVYNVPTDSRLGFRQNTRREDPVYSIPTEIRLSRSSRREDPDYNTPTDSKFNQNFRREDSINNGSTDSRFSRNYRKEYPAYNGATEFRFNQNHRKDDPVYNVSTKSKFSQNSRREDPVYNVPTESRRRNSRRENSIYSAPTEVRRSRNFRREDPVYNNTAEFKLSQNSWREDPVHNVPTGSRRSQNSRRENHVHNVPTAPRVQNHQKRIQHRTENHLHAAPTHSPSPSYFDHE